MLGLPDEFWLALLRPFIGLLFFALIVYPIAKVIEVLLTRLGWNDPPASDTAGFREHPKRVKLPRSK